MSNHITKKGVPIQGTLQENLSRKQKETMGKFVGQKPATSPGAEYFRARLVDIPVDTPSFVNRDTEIKNLVKIVAASGGFDLDLWTPPRSVFVQAMDKTIIVDGDHSRALWKHFFPEAKTLPSYQTVVETLEDVPRRFVTLNATGRTAVRAEEVFVNLCLAGDKQSVEFARKFRSAGLGVYGSHEPQGTAGDPQGLIVKLNAAKKAFGFQNVIVKCPTGSPHAVRYATLLLKECLTATDHFDVPNELLGALTMIMGLYKNLRPGRPDFEVLRGALIHRFQGSSPKEVSTSFKEQGGKIVNYNEYSVAFGILCWVKDPNVRVLNGLSRKYTTHLLSKYFGPK